MKTKRYFSLQSRSPNATSGRLKRANLAFNCQLGRSGLRADKCEGDSATPIGIWPVLDVYYRADRVARPLTSLRVNIIKEHDGWCDDPLDRNYNRPVPLPYRANTEQLWRDDHAYDLIVVLDYNISRRAMNKGSAIFMHLAHDDRRPTAGCLAFCEKDFRMILKRSRPGDLIRIAK